MQQIESRRTKSDVYATASTNPEPFKLQVPHRPKWLRVACRAGHVSGWEIATVFFADLMEVTSRFSNGRGERSGELV